MPGPDAPPTEAGAAVGAEPSLWRNRDFMLLWSGQVVSTLGTRISAIAYPLLVLAITGSPAQAGLVGFALGLPFLVWLLPAGALVDRWSRKRIMLAADGVRAVALGSVAAAVLADQITVAHLLVVAFVEGTCFVFFQLAETAALPHVVPRSQLPTAVAQNQARDQGAELVGQPLGGVLFGLGHVVPFLVDAVTYLVSFLALTPVRPRLEERRDPDDRTSLRRLTAEVAEGVRELRRQRLIMAIMVVAAASNLGFNALFLAILVRARDLGATPAVIGVITGSIGVGAIVGALVAPVTQRRVPGAVIMIGALWLWAAQTLAVALAPSLLTLAIAWAIGGLVGPLFNVVGATYRYLLVPDRLQGRVSSVGKLVAWGTIPIGALGGGLALERFGAVPTMLGISGVMVVAAVLGTASRVIRQAPTLESLRAGAEPAAPVGS